MRVRRTEKFPYRTRINKNFMDIIDQYNRLYRLIFMEVFMLKSIFTLLAAGLALIPAGFAEEEKAAPPAITASKAFKLSGFTPILGTVQKTGVDSVTVRRVRFTLGAAS